MWQAQLLALIEGNSHSIPFLLVVLNAYLYVDPYITLLRNQARLYMLKVDIKEDEQVPGLTFDFVITGLIKSVCTRFSIIFVFDCRRDRSCSTSYLLLVQTPHNDVNLWSIVGLPVVVGCDFLTNICARDPFVHANTLKQRRTWRTHWIRPFNFHSWANSLAKCYRICLVLCCAQILRKLITHIMLDIISQIAAAGRVRGSNMS